MASSSWCKVASNLDSHPKIRKAGRNGREVFLFALRRNAEPGNPVPGRLPADELEPWYIADQLQMPECDAVTGVTAAVTAGLLARDGSSYVIVAWKEGWGKDGGTGAERTARYRENRKLQKSVTPCDGRDVTPVTGDGCDTEEKRGEEKRLEGTTQVPVSPSPPFADAKQALCWFAWNKAATAHRALKASGVDQNARSWPGLPIGEGGKELNARLAELGTDADKREATEAALSHVIAVRVAEAKRTASLRYFTATNVWSSQSFWKASEQSLEQAAAGPPARETPARPEQQPLRASKPL